MGTRDTIILSMFYSDRHQRLGAVMKDYRMSFWDSNDDFGYEKQFMTTETDNFQTKIWFIEYLGLWLTTDKSHRLFSWDL